MCVSDLLDLSKFVSCGGVTLCVGTREWKTREWKTHEGALEGSQEIT